MNFTKKNGVCAIFNRRPKKIDEAAYNIITLANDNDGIIQIMFFFKFLINIIYKI